MIRLLADYAGRLSRLFSRGPAGNRLNRLAPFGEWAHWVACRHLVGR